MTATIHTGAGTASAGFSSLSTGQALGLYRCLQASRRIDELEQELVARGEAFFHVGAAGHEATAALAPLLQARDSVSADSAARRFIRLKATRP